MPVVSRASAVSGVRESTVGSDTTTRESSDNGAVDAVTAAPGDDSACAAEAARSASHGRDDSASATEVARSASDLGDDSACAAKVTRSASHGRDGSGCAAEVDGVVVAAITAGVSTTAHAKRSSSSSSSSRPNGCAGGARILLTDCTIAICRCCCCGGGGFCITPRPDDLKNALTNASNAGSASPSCATVLSTSITAGPENAGSLTRPCASMSYGGEEGVEEEEDGVVSGETEDCEWSRPPLSSKR